MTESEFLQHVDTLFVRITEQAENFNADWDVSQHGALLEIENDDGAKIIINQQLAMQEVWLASREGGYHFKYVDGAWLNTRDDLSFEVYLDKAFNWLNG
ncbi:protein CyaY [Formosimonas limnophila]|uniref:Iron-sulfur cluster assembly protein CyaY n=1 Tax=Formosimonas limnophila TaxID=1384487 RepID=A0A8J3FYZ5_9BURK|nr:iron donor protein CyaY [Formosimonas limnophila]GHA77530.1 protein CyaY [Formosimonas limnophila]